ncbi:metabolite traffic protein EboE [Nocardioides donggukensis]|uniref:Metabolite traffic protein EboE n=1 Tax=Nocardioides donggukensis TaxID=2774019 RepID=A0A927K650_9ACTN|nr:metabolite traffic protein EboE [Nocardioides donggukensis]MBD8870636.1 metabolite traffic protein EboE [Nocardioides donggukensis]
MRFRHPDGQVVHLAYGSNVHPAESLDGILDQLRRYAGEVRARLGVDRLGIGLWLPAPTAHELATHPGALERLRGTLATHGLEVVTLNAFPYRGFHAPVVKRDVYTPDWSSDQRLDYTLDCARVLAALLPDDAARGSISTLPLGWRTPWFGDRDSAARVRLDRLAEGLAKTTADCGRPIRVGLEPEPGCVVETTRDAVRRLSGLDPDHVGVCLDTCHLATAFEDGAEALDRLDAAGLSVVKVQASAALHADDPGDPDTRAALAAYAEDRFLHQTRECRGPRVDGRDDLSDALAGPRPLPAERAWRVHFHVPVHADPAPPLRSTRDHLADSLRALVGGAEARVDHLEVETYTWGVLPPGQRPDGDGQLVDGIAAEVAWVRDRLVECGLEPLGAAA